MTDQYRASVRQAGSYSNSEVTFSFGLDNNPTITAGVIAAIKGYLTSLPNLEVQDFTKSETVISNF